MKETICVRLEYELIQKLGLDKAPNKSDYLREILREYVRLKETEKTYLEVGEKIGILKEDLNTIKTSLGNIKTALGEYKVKKKTKKGKVEEETIPLSVLIRKTIPILEYVEDTDKRVKVIEQHLKEDFVGLLTLLGVFFVLILQVLILLFK